MDGSVLINKWFLSFYLAMKSLSFILFLTVWSVVYTTLFCNFTSYFWNSHWRLLNIRSGFLVTIFKQVWVTEQNFYVRIGRGVWKWLFCVRDIWMTTYTTIVMSTIPINKIVKFMKLINVNKKLSEVIKCSGT